MSALALILCLALPAAAQVATGGIYELDRSAILSGDDDFYTSPFEGRGTVGGGTDFPTQTPSDILEGAGYQLRVGYLNPPPFRYQRSLTETITHTSGNLTVVVPAWSQPKQFYDVILVRDPIANPARVDPNKILEANRKMVANEGPLATVRNNEIWELGLLDDVGDFQGAFSTPSVLTLAFLDVNNDGIVDGTFPPQRVKTLHLYTLDEQNSLWVRVPGAAIDSQSHTVSAALPHYSVYAFIAGADSDVDAVYPYPVPFRPNGPEAGNGPGQSGTAGGGITFTNLPSEGTIEVYTISGALVKHLDIPLNLVPPKLVWDARNSSGQDVASGVYLWKVASRGSSYKTGRLMVIR